MKRRRKIDLETWWQDQIAKSAFFHRKLHEWQLLEIARQLDEIRGESLNWASLSITEAAWNKVIHHGIKPVLVFAHPFVLQQIEGAVSYYRMMAMVSQKSMKRIGIDLEMFERGRQLGDEKALQAAQHLNRIISKLIEADDQLDMREFDLWRGMAAGAQALGAWHNQKGSLAETNVREMILQRLKVCGISASSNTAYQIGDGRSLVFADEPDIAIYGGDIPQVVVEIKGGIDSAGALERVGAALKSLGRVRQAHANVVTVLVVHQVSLTDRTREFLQSNADIINHVFVLNDALDIADRRKFFEVLGI